jgi:hypothetical protein
MNPAMKFPRLTIRRLMILVGFLAVTLAVLRFATQRWGIDGVTGVILAALYAPILAAQFGRFRPHIFWVWFGGYAWLYMALTFFPVLGFRLPTEGLIDALHDRLPSSLTGSSHVFRRVCQLAVALVVGLIAGTFFTAFTPAPQERVPGTRPTFGMYFPTLAALWSWARSK